MPAATGDQNSEQLREVKSVLRSLLISNSKLDVSIRRLDGMYMEEEGETIPFKKFGYSSVQEFLRSMPDVVSLQYNEENKLCAYHVDTEKSAHVSSLVSRQKKPQKRPKNVGYRSRYHHYGNSSYNYSRPPSQQNTMSTINALRLVLDELRKAPKYFQPHNAIRKSDILQKFKERSRATSINSISTLNTKLKELGEFLVLDEDCVYFKQDIFKSNVDAGHNSAQNKAPASSTYQNLQVRSAPIPNPVQKLEPTKQANAYQPPVSQPTQFEQVHRTPATQTDQSQVSTHPSQKKTPPADVPQAHKQSQTSREDRIKFRLQKLLEKHPEGIWAAELPTIYKQEYNLDLDYHESGFNSITQFVSTMPDILRITDPDNTGRHMILDAKIPINKIENKQQTKTQASLYNFHDFVANNQQEPVPNKLSTRVGQKFIPEGMMGFDETVDYINVGALQAEREYFEVNISEIFTPSFFWITLRQNKSKIKKLMNELDEFYKQQDLDACRLPQALIETGLNVACIYAKMWHRAIIKKVKADGYVVVLFYDYGTVKTYNPNNLYYLHKRFSALPAQALACGLHNVKAPQGNEWPILSTNKFVAKVWDIPLVATICEINENNNTMMITLTDTSDENVDLHLNEWMIDEGLAVRGKMQRQENVPSTRYHVTKYGVPLDKLFIYDEDVLKKRDRDYEKSLKIQEQNETQIDHQYTPIKQPDLQEIDSASNYMSNSNVEFGALSIANLVRENIDLTKQTNTITQAILSNMPINKSEVPSRSSGNSSAAVGITSSVGITGSENKIDPATNSCSQEIAKISSDLNRNLIAITSNFSKLVDEPCADVFKTGSVYLDQNRDSNRGSSLVSLNSVSSSSEYMNPRKPASNELSDHCISNQSLYSRQSNSDQSQSTQPSNCQNQQNGHEQEYDKLSFTSGTPTFSYIKHNDNPSDKNRIPPKYPPGFASSFASQFQTNNSNNIINGSVVHEKLNCVKVSDDGYQTIKFSSSAQTSIASSSTSKNLKSKSRPYIPIELSDRCFKKSLHIFHLYDEGWISVNEFIDCFTNLKRDKIMFKMLETFKINVGYKHLSRVDNPQLFSQLDQTKIKAARESDGKIKSDFVLILLPLKAMLHVLAKLDFIDPKTLKEASSLMKQHKENAEQVVFEQFNNKILFDALNVVIQYREFRQFLLEGN